MLAWFAILKQLFLSNIKKKLSFFLTSLQLKSYLNFIQLHILQNSSKKLILSAFNHKKGSINLFRTDKLCSCLKNLPKQNQKQNKQTRTQKRLRIIIGKRTQSQKFSALHLYAFDRSEKNKIQVQKYRRMLASNMEFQDSTNPLTLGYYPVRAKAQLCRLLCEYLHVPYLDLFLNPNQWNQIKHNQAKNWIIKDLPFLVDGDFVVTGSTGCSYYVIQKAGRLELLGRTIEDNIRITTFGNRKDLLGAVIGLVCKVKANRTIEQIKQLRQTLAAKVEPILHIHEKEAKENDWYLGYLSLMDFIIYLVMTQLDQNFPEEVKKLKKLNALKERFLKIPEIYAYQNSSRAVKCYNPVEYFDSFKREIMKSVPNGNLFNSSNINKQMEIE